MFSSQLSYGFFVVVIPPCLLKTNVFYSLHVCGLSFAKPQVKGSILGGGGGGGEDLTNIPQGMWTVNNNNSEQRFDWPVGLSLSVEGDIWGTTLHTAVDVLFL